ncbi:hypothetical protein CRUP_027894, partial [Coryphaenoides rupestris]
MGNAAAAGAGTGAAGPDQGRAESREPRSPAAAGGTTSDQTPVLQTKKQAAAPKLPMPPEDELEERFNMNSINLPPDKLKVLSQYDNEKKWELVCDQDLEISLRTNHIRWAQEFLDEDNNGLDVLVEYLSYAQRATRSLEELPLNKSNSSSHSAHSVGRAARALTVRISNTLNNRIHKRSTPGSQRDDVHVCIMCLRAIMNYQVRSEMR